MRAPVVPTRIQGIRLHSAAGRGARVGIDDGAHLGDATTPVTTPVTTLW